MPREPGNTRGPKWKGPPGLTPAQKKCWSEKQRQKHQAKAARGRQNALRRKNWPATATLRAERAARRPTARPRTALQDALQIVTKATLTRPPLVYIDAQGNLRHEDFRSAQQLIADWKAAQRKKGRP